MIDMSKRLRHVPARVNKCRLLRICRYFMRVGVEKCRRKKCREKAYQYCGPNPTGRSGVSEE